MKLISDLTGLYEGKPILVICGGPTAAEGLKRFNRDAFSCVISANAHGFKQDKFKVDFIVGVDFMFGSGRQPMSEYVKGFDAQTINTWSWADYRIPEWNFTGDSGMTAVQVAVMLGGHPVTVVGLDRYNGDRRYFWEAAPDAMWSQRRVQYNVNAQSAERRLLDFCGNHWVWAPYGAMSAHWKQRVWTPFVRHEAPQVTLRGKPYSLLEPIFLHHLDRIDTGPVILTDGEAKQFLNLRKIVKLEIC